ncbi:hypothetical protein D187_005381 [Cystobacter fuscus DSM 2262]|uniref:Cellulose biosynthesis protein BcsS n=1 Tax=Cystobacter fuscus (strain ATCC 25194 / DSM 2262 / NBRC 100088 / M29) TaxID=1242864 RepID=S9PP46_CYSF2|nr:hypothetical protein [Cystobacter fuscus]EPX64247.1 hypothetical protein D187_005381 [Cystobacter fuscus DSM 2262]
MPSSRSTWCAALAAGCFFTAPLAEARFGGSSTSTPRDARASESRSPSTHDASPVRTEPESPAPAPRAEPPATRARRGLIVPRAGWVPGAAFVAAYRQHRDYPARRPEQPEEEGSTHLVRLGVEAQSARQGHALGLNFGLEEERWGIATRLGGLSLKAEDDVGGRDRLYLADAHVTYAAAVSHRGRLRIETGVAAVRAPDATFVGPSLALSFERCLFGALDLEGRIQWVPLPHLQVDGQMGLALHLGALSVRGGWRGLYLDDRGLVDRVVHTEGIGGPFAGVGLSF